MRQNHTCDLTLISQPNFHLEMVLKTIAVIHLTCNCWLLGTELSLYNEITKPTGLMCTCKVNNINLRLSSILLTTTGPSSPSVYTKYYHQVPQI